MTPRPLPVVAPPADGLATAFREARRRRHRSAAASSSAGALAAMLVLSALAEGGTTRLVQEPADPATQTRRLLELDRPVPAQPVEPPVSPVLTSEPSSAAATSPLVAAVPVAQARPGSEAGAGDSGSRRGVAALRRKKSGPATGSASRDEYTQPYLPDDLGCVQRTGQPLCSSMSWGTTGAKQTVRLYTCNKSASPVPLRFSQREEVRFEVWKDDELLFHTVAKRVPDEHVVVIESTLCAIWVTSWSGLRPDGSPVTGTVRATATLLTDGAGAARSASTHYTPSSS